MEREEVIAKLKAHETDSKPVAGPLHVVRRARIPTSICSSLIQRANLGGSN
jgi:hypothetical protein